MAKMKEWWLAHRPTRRRLIQVYAALLYNAHVKGFIEGEIYTGPLKNVCVPGFNCYSCPGAIGACPLGALQNALASSANRAPAYVLGILLLFGLTLGRTICGWLCPLGLLQELVYKVPTPKVRKNRFTRVMSWLKYVILAVFVVLVPLAYSLQKYPVPAFCKYICPAGTLEGAVGLLSNPVNAEKFSMLGILFTRKFVILVLLVLACVFVYRAFCRFICPLGAIYGLFCRLALVGVRVDLTKCTDCGRCVAQCRMDIRHVGDHECIHCGECVPMCPSKAISWHAGKIVRYRNEVEKMENQHAVSKAQRTRGIVSWACALAVLFGVMWYVNWPAQVPAEAEAPAPTAVEEADVEDTTSVGPAVGMRAPDFTVPLYGEAGGDFTLADTRGKPVVINFWATWCTPCCAELPHFQQLYDTYPEQFSLVAVHSSLVAEDVQAYLNARGYTIPFALDEDGSVFSALGGTNMIPLTVVLDSTGKIVYNRVGAVTYAQLESLLLPLL